MLYFENTYFRKSLDLKSKDVEKNNQDFSNYCVRFFWFFDRNNRFRMLFVT